VHFFFVVARSGVEPFAITRSHARMHKHTHTHTCTNTHTYTHANTHTRLTNLCICHELRDLAVVAGIADLVS